MKKIFILLLFFINISCFAETKIYNGIGLAKDTFLSETLKKTKIYKTGKNSYFYNLKLESVHWNITYKKIETVCCTSETNIVL